MNAPISNGRPSTLSSLWAQVFDVRTRPAAASTRGLLAGQPTVRGPVAYALSQSVGLGQDRERMVRPAAKRYVGGDSGTPPRGRPV